ncbi:MAG: 50S ribosomal protein L30 [Bacteroidales bacterium]
MKKYKIVQTRSRIGRPARQKKTLDALGLKRMNRPVYLNVSPQIDGMIEKVKHLVSVEEVNE